MHSTGVVKIFQYILQSVVPLELAVELIQFESGEGVFDRVVAFARLGALDVLLEEEPGQEPE